MADERAYLYRNTGTKASPVWEKWYPRTMADAVEITCDDGRRTNLDKYLKNRTISSDSNAVNFAEVEGETTNKKLWTAMNTGGKYTNSEKKLTLLYEDCSQPGTGIGATRWYVAYRDNYPEMDDGKETIIENTVFEAEGENPILLQPLYKSGSLTFENCTFRNVLFWFGRSYKHKFVFKNCVIEDNQYNFIQCGEWNCNAEYHIENCTFRHMRPNFEEYRNDIVAQKFNGWAHGNIRCLGFDVKWYIKDTIFEDCMGKTNIFFGKSSHATHTDPTAVELYMERCTIRKTNGAGISFSGQPVTGRIKDCDFYNIGENRCNEEKYDLPEESKVQSGSGTEDDPYIYACGVGSNGIFSYNWTPRHELVISGNRIYNVMENGIEGNYREVSYNHIENTGYRIKEGLWNPSTEGLYGNFAVCKGNVILNPTKNEQGIVIPGTYQDGQTMVYEDNLIMFDKDNEDSNSTGILVIIEQESFTSPLYIQNNSIKGFSKKYDIYNKMGISLKNIHIKDIGEQNNVLSSSDYNQKNLIGTTYGSDKEKAIVRDSIFAQLDENGSPTEWKVFYGDATVYKTKNERFIRVLGTSMKSCACLSQDYHLNGDIYVARIRCKVRSSSGKIGFAPLSLDDNGSVISGYENLVFNPKMCTIDIPGEENEWREVTHSMVITQNCRINILNPSFDDAEGLEHRSTLDVKDIDIRISRIQTYSDNDGEIEVAGTLFDFSKTDSAYLPANAMNVTYWIPGKDYSYTGSWEDATWMMGKNTGNDRGRGRIAINSDCKQYSPLTVWYDCDFDLELNGHTLECASDDVYSFLSLYNGAKVRIVGPGIIKAKNYALLVSTECSCTVENGVSLLTTGDSFAISLSEGDSKKQAELIIHGGIFGKILSGAFSNIDFDLQQDADVAEIAYMQTKGSVTIKKNTKILNGNSTPPTEIINIKTATGLFYSKNLQCSYMVDHAENEIQVVGDESSVSYTYTDLSEKICDGTGSITDLLTLAKQTNDKRTEAFVITLQDDIYTYTGLYASDIGDVILNLNGYSIRNDYQSYALTISGKSNVTIIDSSSQKTGTIESTNYATIIASSGATLNVNGGTVKQATGIAVKGSGATIVVSGDAMITGKIALYVEKTSIVKLQNGKIIGEKFGIQENIEDSSATEIIVTGGYVESSTTIFAKNVTFSATEGITATLKGLIDLRQSATISSNTKITVDDVEVNELKKNSGTILVTFRN